MIKIFRKLSLGLPLTVVILCVLFVNHSFGQTCPTCTPNRSETLPNTGTLASPTNVTFNNASGNIFKFSGTGFYSWTTNNTISLRGIILEHGVYMTLGSRNQGNTEAFSIIGVSATDRGCIIVKSGATLDLAWISTLKYVDVCVEDGGKIIFDSDDDRDNNARNTYTFDGVTINLQGPDAKLEFGDANINIVSGLDIVGWTGDLVCPTGDSPNPSSTGQSGNISWNSDTVNICAILNFGVLPVEYLSFIVNHIANTRSNEIKWVTASEKNNSHFVLERSVNDIKSWVAIGEVAGAINSEMPQDYSYTDEKLPLAGGMIYYRLKQVDLEGKYYYGEVIATRVTGINSATTWRVYPNPSAGNDIYLELTNQEKYKGESISLRLLSANPQISQQQVTVNDIFTLTEALRGISQSLNKGVAVLEIIWGNQVEHIKLIKK